METANTYLLKEPISSLPLSKELKGMAIINGFENLDAILAFPLTFLLKRPEFSYHVYQELVGFLKMKDLLHLLKHE